MTIKVRKISKSEVPKRPKTYRPELTQANGHIAETIASLLDMSIADLVNQVFEKAEFVELISERKNIAITLNGPVGKMDQGDFDQLMSAVEEYEDNLEADDKPKEDDEVGTESSDAKPAAKDLGKSKPTVESSRTVSGIGAAVLSEDDDLNLEDGESEGEEDLDEAVNNI